MIISHKHRFAFVHNPKVAGSAVRQVLHSLHDDKKDFWHQKFFPQLDRVVDAAHLTVHDLKLVRPRVFDEGYKIFSMVRNPYDRFSSALAEHVRQHGAYRYFTVDDWVEKNMDETNFRFNWKYIHFCPQHYFVPEDPMFSTVIKHENLKEDWYDTFVPGLKELGVTEDLHLPKVRVRPDNGNDFFLSEFAVQAINRVYHRDFERFGYKRYEVKRLGSNSDHYQRVCDIHSPYLQMPDEDWLNDGELIAYEQQLKLRE